MQTPYTVTPSLYSILSGTSSQWSSSYNVVVSPRSNFPVSLITRAAAFITYLPTFTYFAPTHASELGTLSVGGLAWWQRRSSESRTQGTPHKRAIVVG